MELNDNLLEINVSNIVGFLCIFLKLANFGNFEVEFIKILTQIWIYHIYIVKE